MIDEEGIEEQIEVLENKITVIELDIELNKTRLKSYKKDLLKLKQMQKGGEDE